MFLLNGSRLQPGIAFTHGDIQYPANWLNLSSLEEKQAIGIIEVEDQTRPDDRFYWVTDNGNGVYTSIPKQLEDVTEENESVTKGLKTQWTLQFKNTANTLLASTDWMVTRKSERNVDIPEKVVTYRAAVLAELDRLETAINETSDIEGFILVVQSTNWPTGQRL